MNERKNKEVRHYKNDLRETLETDKLDIAVQKIMPPILKRKKFIFIYGTGQFNKSTNSGHENNCSSEDLKCIDPK